jgi:hypothetical protein
MSGGYPEHEKLGAVVQESEAIGEFLEWCYERGWYLCQPTGSPFEGCYRPVPGSINDYLAAHFGIDQKKLEAEKRQMLNEQRALNAERTT